MDQCTKDWIDIIAKGFTATGVVIAAWGFQSQVKTRRAEWLKSLFEKFYQEERFKEVRKWIESGDIEYKVNKGSIVSDNDEKFADYLNFFEFIATLNSRRRLKKSDVLDMFDFYLKKLKTSPACMDWINDQKYGFEKLRTLLSKIKE